VELATIVLNVFSMGGLWVLLLGVHAQLHNDKLFYFYFSYYLGGLLFIECLFIAGLFLASGFLYVIPWENSMGFQNHGIINHT
jgi:hypothetical protein